MSGTMIGALVGTVGGGTAGAPPVAPPPMSRSSGSSAAQMSCAFQHRVRNRQPEGGWLGLGISPDSGT